MSSTTRDPSERASMERGIFEGVIEALANKHSQLDINFQRTSIKFPGIQQSLELNGTITVSVHMRELTSEEKQALAQKNVALVTSGHT